jgi:hypothetical protein
VIVNLPELVTIGAVVSSATLLAMGTRSIYRIIIGADIKNKIDARAILSEIALLEKLNPRPLVNLPIPTSMPPSAPPVEPTGGQLQYPFVVFSNSPPTNSQSTQKNYADFSDYARELGYGNNFPKPPNFVTY